MAWFVRTPGGERSFSLIGNEMKLVRRQMRTNSQEQSRRVGPRSPLHRSFSKVFCGIDLLFSRARLPRLRVGNLHRVCQPSRKTSDRQNDSPNIAHRAPANHVPIAASRSAITSAAPQAHTTSIKSVRQANGPSRRATVSRRAERPHFPCVFSSPTDATIHRFGLRCESV